MKYRILILFLATWVFSGCQNPGPSQFDSNPGVGQQLELNARKFFETVPSSVDLAYHSPDYSITVGGRRLYTREKKTGKLWDVQEVPAVIAHIWKGAGTNVNIATVQTMWIYDPGTKTVAKLGDYSGPFVGPAGETGFLSARNKNIVRTTFDEKGLLKDEIFRLAGYEVEDAALNGATLVLKVKQGVKSYLAEASYGATELSLSSKVEVQANQFVKLSWKNPDFAEAELYDATKKAISYSYRLAGSSKWFQYAEKRGTDLASLVGVFNGRGDRLPTGAAAFDLFGTPVVWASNKFCRGDSFKEIGVTDIDLTKVNYVHFDEADGRLKIAVENKMASYLPALIDDKLSLAKGTDEVELELVKKEATYGRFLLTLTNKGQFFASKPSGAIMAQARAVPLYSDVVDICTGTPGMVNLLAGDGRRLKTGVLVDGAFQVNRDDPLSKKYDFVTPGRKDTEKFLFARDDLVNISVDVFNLAEGSVAPLAAFSLPAEFNDPTEAYTLADRFVFRKGDSFASYDATGKPGMRYDHVKAFYFNPVNKIAAGYGTAGLFTFGAETPKYALAARADMSGIVVLDDGTIGILEKDTARNSLYYRELTGAWAERKIEIRGVRRGFDEDMAVLSAKRLAQNRVMLMLKVGNIIYGAVSTPMKAKS